MRLSIVSRSVSFRVGSHGLVHSRGLPGTLSPAHSARVAAHATRASRPNPASDDEPAEVSGGKVISGYALFLKERMKGNKKDPSLERYPIGEVSKEWKNLSEAARQEYNKRAKAGEGTAPKRTKGYYLFLRQEIGGKKHGKGNEEGGQQALKAATEMWKSLPQSEKDYYNQMAAEINANNGFKTKELKPTKGYYLYLKAEMTGGSNTDSSNNMKAANDKWKALPQITKDAWNKKADEWNRANGFK